jgi:uncharacterized protein YggU (UPF0235/DUF167 family)
MRVEIHVRPNASKAAVGGTHDRALVVRVREPAEGGRATAAALKAVAAALQVPNGSVTLVRGATTRRKLLQVATAPAEEDRLSRRLERLLEHPPA